MTTVVKQKPFYINNLFDDFFEGLTNSNNWNNTPVNIHENGDGFHIELNAPGRNKDDFKLSIDKNLLTISYTKKDEKLTENYKTLRREFSAESFKRSFNLTENMNTDSIKAKYENGVLAVFLPKKEEAKQLPKEISIA